MKEYLPMYLSFCLPSLLQQSSWKENRSFCIDQLETGTTNLNMFIRWAVTNL